MSPQMLLGVSVAVLLPWLAGSLWVRAVLSGRPMCNFPVVLGYGFPLGVLLTIGTMSGWEALGWDQGFWRTCGVLAVLASISLFLQKGRRVPSVYPPLLQKGGQGGCERSELGGDSIALRAHPPQPPFASTGEKEGAVCAPACKKCPTAAVVREGGRLWRIVCWVLLALLLFRFAGFFLEIIWRPVYPWDAWFYYAPRAKVWFEYGSLVEFVPPSEWRSAVEPAFTAGSGRHPDGIPLIQYWALQGLGRFDDALMNLPWFFAAVSGCLALYGMARAAGAGVLIALAAVYVLVSLPMFGTHVALAGYGELWVGLFMLLASGGVYFSIRDRDWRPFALALPAVAGMLIIKETAPFWILPLGAGFLFGWLRFRWALLIAVISGLAAVAAAFLLDVDFEAGNLGRFAVGPGGVEFPGYRPIWDALAAHLFFKANWHLLWFAVPVVLVVALIQSRRDRALRALSVLVGSGLFLLLLAFTFTEAASWVVDGTSVNRILLHLVPALVLLGAIVCSRFARIPPNPPSQAKGGTAIPPYFSRGLAFPFFRSGGRGDASEASGKFTTLLAAFVAALLLWSGFILWTLNAQPETFSFGQLQARLFGDWLDFRVWNTPSINRIEAAEGEALVPPSAAVAAWVALSALMLALLMSVRGLMTAGAGPGKGLLRGVVAIVAVGWLLLDLRWQADLLYRLNDSRVLFAGKSGDERRAADFDGPLFEFLQSVKAEIGDPHARIWIFAENDLLHFRARYHVLPQPAHSSSDPLTVGVARRLRGGDYIVLLDDRVVQPGGVRFSRSPPPHELMQRHTADSPVEAGTIRVPPRFMPYPGFYAMRVDLEDAGDYRLQVRLTRRYGEPEILAERSVRAGSPGEVLLPFLMPAPGQVDFRIKPESETAAGVGEVTVEWLPEQDRFAFLAAGRDGPFVVVRPFLRSDAALAFEVL